MQTILGANGVIGRELSAHLLGYTDKIRQVSRNPKKVNPGDELVAADLLDYDQTMKAVAGSEIVYLLVGLKYDTRVWQQQWPIVMRNTIDACKKHQCKLVFFDNVYAYGLVDGKMTEETPFNPISRKGEVRAKIATMLLEEIRSGNLQGMIVRSADFYGPNAWQSMTHYTVTERLRAGKRPQWLGDPKKIHTLTYTPDAGKTLAVLGNTPTAYNQTWHALTSKELISAEQFVRIPYEILNQPPKKIMTLPGWTLHLLGLFSPMMRELKEMMYQVEQDYIFDSSKFETTFDVKATSYTEGIARMLNSQVF